MSRIISCAAEGWSTGSTTGYSVPCGGARLSVRRILPGGGSRPGDHHGRVFPSSEAASAFALERGYTVPYFHSERSVFKRIHRAALRAIMARARAALAAAQDGPAVVAVADQVRDEVLALGCGVLMPAAWCNGVYRLARHMGVLPPLRF